MTKFIPGVSGNPAGRQQGVPNKRTQLIKHLEEKAEELIAKAIELASSGDSNMLRFCLERLIPKPRGELMKITLPGVDMSKPSSIVLLGTKILDAVTNEQISPEQGKLLSDLAEAQRKNLETFEMDNRLKEIERVLNSRKTGERHA